MRDAAAVEGLVLGLDIGGTKLAAGIVDQHGEVRSFLRSPTPTSGTGWNEAMDELFRLGHRAIEAAGIAPTALAAVGIGCGGPLDLTSGAITGPPNLPDWDDVPVCRLAAEAFDRPVVLENDANAAALASYRWGEWAGTDDLVYLTISTGIGGGAIIDGRLLRGASGNAAELGHTVIAWRGRQCECGQRGCAEAYVSGTSIARRAIEVLGTGRASVLSGRETVTAADVAVAAAGGDELAMGVWSETTEILGTLVASLLSIFEPKLVVLGGGVTEAGAMLIDPVRAHASAQAMSSAGRAAAIILSPHGAAIGVLGAAAAATTQLRLGSERM